MSARARWMIGLMMVALALGALGASAQAVDAASADAFARHHNLGKAFFENPVTQYEAVEQFARALAVAPDEAAARVNHGLSLIKAGKDADGIAELERAQTLDPSIPHTWFNLGVAYKRASRYAEAIAQFEGMIARVDDEPISHYNLGVLYRLDGREADGIRHIETAARLAPSLAAPHFQLANAYRKAKRLDDAKVAMRAFRERKALQRDALEGERLEWSRYAEIYDVIAAPSVPAAPSAAPPRFAAQAIAAGDGAIVRGRTGLRVTRVDADARPDVIAWSDAGVAVLLGGRDALAPSGLALRGVVDVDAADADNDGAIDLVVVTADGAQRARGDGAGRFTPDGPAIAGRFDRALWLDVDHDADADLVLLGRDARVVRNAGAQGFEAWPDALPLPAGRVTAAARIDLVADHQGADLVVVYADRPAIVLRDRLGGHYDAEPLASLPRGATALVARDVDRDGWVDLVVGGADGVALLRNDGAGALGAAASIRADGGAALAPIDADMRGWLDLATADGLLRNVGRGRFVPSTAAGLDALDAPLALAADDFDGDGDVDLLAAVAAGGDDGATRLVRHDRVAGNARWLRVDLTGVRNPRVPIGAEIEVRAGQRYQKLPYRGVPLTFGVGDAAEVDTVRVTWPNGLIQNEPRQATGASYVYPEAQRLSGSCPMVYTWNGVEFTFITDVLGVAPLGVRTADGGTFPADHDETIQIAADQLVPDADGMLDVRITEELREIAYLDEIQLIAVDRPASLAVVTSDKFKAPPFPDFQLYGLDDPHKPIAARDHRGRDVRDAILRRDRTYPTGFTRTLTGLAEPHHLTLDFGPDAAPDGRALLVLHGWVDWADGSTFQASTQAGAPPQLPVLQAEDDDGRWVTIDADMGLPAGKPKTIAVAVDFPGRSRALRIVTNLCVYWDAIALEDDPRGTDAFRLTRLHATTARLGFGGFARVVVDPARLQPEVFVYADKRPTSMWNPARGLYTRYGDVGPLLNRIDDRFVIMGAGDELQLRFDARALPSLADGHVREWLLFVDGWAKDGDANTAHALTVEPLPYHGMPGYPYAAPDGYPDDPVRRLYREHYNVRPALRLIRPLTEGLVPAPAAAAAAAATEAER